MAGGIRYFQLKFQGDIITVEVLFIAFGRL